MKKHWLLLFFTLCFVGFLSAQNNKILASDNLKAANMSLLIKDLNTGFVVFDYRPNKVAIPASITKLVTTATALELLGSDFCFQTKLEYSGTIDKDSVLNGNLYIHGGGDPTLGSKYLGDADFMNKWVDAVKALGIKHIKGAIISDASLYNTEGISPRWSWEDMGNYYAAGAYALSVGDNTCTAYLKSGAVGTTPELLRTEPTIPNLKFNLFLKSTTIDADSAYFYGAPFANERSLYGAIPANKAEFPVKADIPNPPLFLAQLFTSALKHKGICVDSIAEVSFEAGQNRTAFYTQLSPPLKDIIKDINFRSNNHYAEHVFRYLALQEYPVASSNGAIDVVKNFWKSKGLDVSAVFLYDGCGLAASDALSADFFVDILNYMYTKSLNKDAFVASLPIAGESGTVKKLLKGTRLEGKVHAKSGSISAVQCYAGYVDGKEHTYAFALMMNHYTGSRKEVVSQLESILLSIPSH